MARLCERAYAEPSHNEVRTTVSNGEAWRIVSLPELLAHKLLLTRESSGLIQHKHTVKDIRDIIECYPHLEHDDLFDDLLDAHYNEAEAAEINDSLPRWHEHLAQLLGNRMYHMPNLPELEARIDALLYHEVNKGNASTVAAAISGSHGGAFNASSESAQADGIGLLRAMRKGLDGAYLHEWSA
jgi:hypothetical protein